MREKMREKSPKGGLCLVGCCFRSHLGVSIAGCRSQTAEAEQKRSDTCLTDLDLPFGEVKRQRPGVSGMVTALLSVFVDIVRAGLI